MTEEGLPGTPNLQLTVVGTRQEPSDFPMSINDLLKDSTFKKLRQNLVPSLMANRRGKSEKQ